MSSLRCPACQSREVYHSSHHWHERCLRWLHHGRRFYHCHACGRQFWVHDSQQDDSMPSAHLESSTATRTAPDATSPVHMVRMVLQCPSCGVAKTWVGRWWDDFWTWSRGHNKLYRCRKCKTVFAPPP